jgi:luciferase-like monooxygenase
VTHPGGSRSVEPRPVDPRPVESGPGPQPPQPQPGSVKVGVRLAAQAGDTGEWLADGASFEAAGAHALWVGPDAEPVLDPLALAAALAAVTYRALLVAPLPVVDASPRGLARTLATIGLLSRGRLRVVTGAGPGADLADLAGVAGGTGVLRRLPGDPEVFEPARGAGEAGRWIAVAAPDGRASWRATLLDVAQRGFTGLVVPANPRLLDILRNPEDPDQRRDLQLAQG